MMLGCLAVGVGEGVRGVVVVGEAGVVGAEGAAQDEISDKPSSKPATKTKLIPFFKKLTNLLVFTAFPPLKI